jgi:hypothetical protein
MAERVPAISIEAGIVPSVIEIAGMSPAMIFEGTTNRLG